MLERSPNLDNGPPRACELRGGGWEVAFAGSTSQPETQLGLLSPDRERWALSLAPCQNQPYQSLQFDLDESRRESNHSCPPARSILSAAKLACLVELLAWVSG